MLREYPSYESTQSRSFRLPNRTTQEPISENDPSRLEARPYFQRSLSWDRDPRPPISSDQYSVSGNESGPMPSYLENLQALAKTTNAIPSPAGSQCPTHSSNSSTSSHNFGQVPSIAAPSQPDSGARTGELDGQDRVIFESLSYNKISGPPGPPLPNSTLEVPNPVGGVCALQPAPSEHHPDYLCDWFGWTPRFLQNYTPPMRVVLALFCFASFLEAVVVNGLLNAVQATLQTRYQMSATDTGAIVSTFDVIVVLFLIPLAYYGGWGRKPRYIGLGICVLGLGSLFFGLAQFFAGEYTYETPVEPLCYLPGVSYPETGNVSYCNTSSISNFKYFFIGCQIFIGIGSVPIFTIAITYIDENSTHAKSALYVGIYLTMALIGSLAGYVIAGGTLMLYVDPFHPPSNLTSSSPLWVGAWWIGFIVCAALLFLLSIPISGFPKKLLLPAPDLPATKSTYNDASNGAVTAARSEATGSEPLPEKSPSETRAVFRVDTDPVENSTFSYSVNRPASTVSIQDDYGSTLGTFTSTTLSTGTSSTANLVVEKPVAPPLPEVSLHASPATTTKHKDWKSFFRAVKIVVTCVPFWFLSFSNGLEMFLISGLAVNAPTFVATQFNLSASLSSIVFGVTVIPVAALAIFLGGLTLRYFKVGSSRRPATYMLLIAAGSSFISIPFSVVFLLRCETALFAGVNQPYTNQSPDSFPSLPNSMTNNDTVIHQANLARLLYSCNAKCYSSPSAALPSVNTSTCNPDMYSPLCGADSLLYYSPCHAGCEQYSFAPDGTQIYSKCACIFNGVNLNALAANASSFENAAYYNASLGVQYAIPGSCGSASAFAPQQHLSCLPRVIFLILLVFFLGFFEVFPTTPSTEALLRLMPEGYGSLALAVNSIIFRLIGPFPGPIIMGVLIDSACVFWRYTCGERGDCIEFDGERFAILLLIETAVVRILVCFCYSVAALFAWRQERTRAHVPAPAAVGTEVADLSSTHNPRT